jgi:hypothetical protein
MELSMLSKILCTIFKAISFVREHREPFLVVSVFLICVITPTFFFGTYRIAISIVAGCFCAPALLFLIACIIRSILCKTQDREDTWDIKKSSSIFASFWKILKPKDRKIVREGAIRY